MTEKLDEHGWGRFNTPPPIGPHVNIYGGVRWPEDWDTERRWQHIENQKNLVGNPEDPDGPIAVLEYSLDPTCRERPDPLKWWKDHNPKLEWPDTYPDGTSSPIPRPIQAVTKGEE